jgi:hypothetical protein
LFFFSELTLSILTKKNAEVQEFRRVLNLERTEDRSDLTGFSRVSSPHSPKFSGCLSGGV